MKDVQPTISSDLKFVVPFLKPHLKLIVYSILSMAFLALTTSAYAYLVGPALKIILTSLQQQESNLAVNILENVARSLQAHPVTVLVAAIIILAVIRSAAQMSEVLLIGKAGQNIQMDVRNAIFQKLMDAKPLAMLKVRKGDLTSKLVVDVSMMELAITHAIASLIRDGLQIIFLAALAFYLNAKLTLVAILILPVGALVVYYLSGKIRKAYRNAMNQRGRIAGMFIESARGLPVVKIFLAERQQVERLRKANLNLMKSMMRAIYLAASPSPVMEILASTALGLLLLYVITVSKTHVSRPENFISFFAAVFLLYRPIKSLGSVTSFLQQGLAATRRIRAIFETETESEGGERRAPSLKEEIRIHDVHFSYDERPILSALNLSIPGGKITAVVGASGEGKTTLIHLLCGFLRPVKGNILWEGIDYSELERVSLRNRISLIPQDPFLMNTSIEENILLGRNMNRRDNLQRAVTAGGLEKLLSRLKDGLQTNVEEEASSLSTGERQRICIARAILSDTDLIIFDEAASSLDSLSEDAIHSSLKKISRDKTIIVVSHRLSTVKMADKIAVMEGGKIVEEGKYGELARPGTVFHGLFSSQIIKSRS